MEQPVRPSASAEDLFDSSAITAMAAAPSPGIARQAAPIVALSEDPMLLEAIASATLDLVQVIVSPSTDRFVDQIVATGGELVLIDATAVPDKLSEFLELVHRQFPQLQLLLAGPGNVQHQIGAQLTDGTVYRFVHKPASAQRLRLFIDSALRERQTRITEEILRSPVADRFTATPPPRGSGRRWGLTAALCALALIAAAGAVVWYSSLSDHAPRSQTDTPATAAAASSSAPVVAPAAPAVATPPATPPATPAARSTSTPGATEAEQEAIDRAAAERSERSEKERLAAEADARQAALAEQTRRADNEARQAEIHQLVQKARGRIASGALIEPADDSARTYVSAAQDQGPDEQEVRAVSVALGEAMISSFRKALASGDVTSAEKWLTACRSYQIAPPTLDQMSVQLESFRAAEVAQTSALKAVDRAPTADAPAAEGPAAEAPAAPPPASAVTAAPASAHPTTSVTSQAVQASSDTMQEGFLHRIQFNPPKYPPDAVMHHQTGAVELDFTVLPTGAVAEIKVTKSDPIGVFEQAATAALSRNRYEPVERNGVPVAQRAHIRMRFAL